MRLLLLVFVFVPLFTAAKARFVRAIFRTDPATTVCIGWDQVSGNAPVLEYRIRAKSSEGPTKWQAMKPSRIEEVKGFRMHYARLTGLIPNTAYELRVVDSDDEGRLFYVETLPNSPEEPLSIVAGGDSRSDREARRNTNILVGRLRPHLVLFGGDLTMRGSPNELEAWFEDWDLTTLPDGRLTPVIAARGNHEASNLLVDQLFDWPHPDGYFAVTVGGGLARLYTLNTEMAIPGAQTDWLAKDLHFEGLKATWRIPQYHKPMRPHVSRKREGDAQYMAWAELFYAHRVQLVVECDAHVVKRTWPIRPSTAEGSHEGFVRDDDKGTVYVGEGTWAPLRTADDSKPWTRAADAFHQVKWLWVRKTSLEVRCIKSNNGPEVGTVTPEKRFKLPKNAKVWDAPNGAVLKLKP